MGKQINEREVVLEILMEITENGAYSHKILGDVLSKISNILRNVSVHLSPELWKVLWNI